MRILPTQPKLLPPLRSASATPPVILDTSDCSDASDNNIRPLRALSGVPRCLTAASSLHPYLRGLSSGGCFPAAASARAACVSPSATAAFVSGGVPHPTALAFLVVRGGVALQLSLRVCGVCLRVGASPPHRPSTAQLFPPLPSASPPLPVVLDTSDSSDASDNSRTLPHHTSALLEVRGASPPPPAVSPASLTARQPFWCCAVL